MTHITCRLTAKNQDQLRNPIYTLGNRVWASFTFFYPLILLWRLWFPQRSRVKPPQSVRSPALVLRSRRSALRRPQQSNQRSIVSSSSIRGLRGDKGVGQLPAIRTGRGLDWRRYEAAWTDCVPEDDEADLASLTRPRTGRRVYLIESASTVTQSHTRASCHGFE